MKVFLFSFKMAIKPAGSAQNIRVGRVSGNTAILFGLKCILLQLLRKLTQLIYAFLRAQMVALYGQTWWRKPELSRR